MTIEPEERVEAIVPARDYDAAKSRLQRVIDGTSDLVGARLRSLADHRHRCVGRVYRRRAEGSSTEIRPTALHLARAYDDACSSSPRGLHRLHAAP
jgi:hypothetical protein